MAFNWLTIRAPLTSITTILTMFAVFLYSCRSHTTAQVWTCTSTGTELECLIRMSHKCSLILSKISRKLSKWTPHKTRLANTHVLKTLKELNVRFIDLFAEEMRQKSSFLSNSFDLLQSFLVSFWCIVWFAILKQAIFYSFSFFENWWCQNFLLLV